jgi:endonuclease YncB( thermonuclease family)
MRTRLDRVAVVLLPLACLGWLITFIVCSEHKEQSIRQQSISLIKSTMYPVNVLRIYDGDTVWVNIDLGFDLVLKNKSLRFSEFDAWEINRVRRTVEITDEEIVKGKQARDALVKLISDQQLFLESEKQTDPYGRLNGTLYFYSDGWVNVTKWLIENGHAR